MQKLFVSLMCFFTLVGVNSHAEEINSDISESSEKVVKTIPYKLNESGKIQEVSTTFTSSAFLLSPPPDSFILRNSLQVSDSNSRELPLKVIGSLNIGTLADQKYLILKDPFRVMVDLKKGNKIPKFLTITFTACKAENVCFYPISLKVMLND
jgi:hypothetical protein